MQFCKKLSTAILPNRALFQRVIVVDERPKFTLPSIIRNLSDCSSDCDKAVSALPSKPKRPMGVFLRFMKLVEPNVIQDHPSAKRKGIVKIIAGMYKNIDEKLRLTLQEEYLKEKERYIQETESYSSKLSEEQKQTLYEAQLHKKKQKLRKELKKKAVEFKKPKRPPNAYLLFVQSKKSHEMLSGNLTEWAKKIGNEWNNLSLEEKNMYKEKAKQLLHEYENDLCNWESKMDDLGHSDLLRKEKNSRNTSKSQSESMAVAANLSNYAENVIHRYSEIDKDEKKNITSNERKPVILSSFSHECDSKGSGSISYSKHESTENNYSFDENSSKLRNAFLNKLVFFLNSYLSDKRTVHIMMGVTFFLIFLVWPLLYSIR